MVKSKKYFLILGLTILLCMVFSVGIGYTFCASVYELSIDVLGKSSAGGEETFTYLHDTQISNSTSEIPIPYKLGSVDREISFDYSFSQNTDFVVKYTLTYTDGTAVTNARLNINNRDDYIVDMPTIVTENDNLNYNSSTNAGTMYYLPYVTAGSGKVVLFTGVTFTEGVSSVDYTNKKLKIDLKVYTKANVTATNKSATEYYTNSHYFSNYIQSDNVAFTNWINYKKTTNQGSASVPANIAMVYNGRASFELGVPYTYDFDYGVDITTSERIANVKSSYLYTTDNKFFAYAAGNKFDAGVGVYYMAKDEGSLKVTIGVNWYNPQGEKVQDMPISNANVVLNEKFSLIESINYGYTKKLSANSYGYIDVVEYIETISKGDLYNYVGWKLVITSLTATYTTSYESGWTPSGFDSKSNVFAHNSTDFSAVHYRYATEMTTDSTLDFNVSIENDTDNAIVVNSVNVTPKFYAYNAQTGTNYGVAKTRTDITFGNSASQGTRFIYNSNSWSLSGGTNGVYTFASNGIYIAPHSSLTLLTGVYVANQTEYLNDWKVTIDAIEYFADYWFVAEIGNISYSTASLNKSLTTQAEIISELTSATISSGATSYIAVKNNTMQTMTNVTFTGSLVNKLSHSSDISCTLTRYDSLGQVNLGEGQAFTITFTGINLLPGESIILGKVVASSGANIGFETYSISANLSSAPSYSSVYAYRDFASGNLSIKNPTNVDATIKMTMKDFSNNASSISVSALNGGSDKWTLATTYNYDTPLRPTQALLVLTNYYSANICPTFM